MDHHHMCDLSHAICCDADEPRRCRCPLGHYENRAAARHARDAARPAGAAASAAVPCGLLEGGKAAQAIRKGELLTYQNCAVDETSRIVMLRKRQDDMLKGTVG
jgi:predicted homoserine dehydrogenase-like protein